MKHIVWNQNGTLRRFSPQEAVRRARSITLADGTRLAYVRVIEPAVQDVNGKTVTPAVTELTVCRADEFLRRWPVPGAVVEWAETEKEFLDRLRAKVVPAGATDVFYVDPASVPTERMFRNALRVQVAAPAGEPPFAVIEHDLQRCRGIAHSLRRDRRAEEFRPLDVEVTIPALAVESEAKRQVIRDKYATIQTDIDAAGSVYEIKVALT